MSADGSAQQKDSEQTPVPSFGKMSDQDEKHTPISIQRFNNEQHKPRNTRSLSESSCENGLTEGKRDEFNRVKSTKKSAQLHGSGNFSLGNFSGNNDSVVDIRGP